MAVCILSGARSGHAAVDAKTPKANDDGPESPKRAIVPGTDHYCANHDRSPPRDPQCHHDPECTLST
jgi:hypothetical protein